MESVELVIAVRREHEHRDLADPPSEQAKNIERGLVCPVRVLDDEHGRGRGERLEQLHGDLMRSRATFDELLEIACQGPGNLGDRPERSRCEERVARPEQHPSVTSVLVAEVLHESGLADPRLTPDESEPALALSYDCLEAPAERLERRIALEKRSRRPARLCDVCHTNIVAYNCSPFKSA